MLSRRFDAFGIRPKCILAAALLWQVAYSQANVTVINPAEIDSVLYNPGIGIETMNNFDGGPDPTYAQYPKSRLAYFRPSWADLEPQRGQIDFAGIDQFINTAVLHGQKMGFRVVLLGTGAGRAMPQWFRDLVGGTWYGDYFWPDWENPIFLQEMERIVKALGERYNGHPGVAYWDIGIMGCWGEWNNACADGAPMWSAATAQKIIDMHVAAFTATPLLLLAGITDYGQRGLGWRGDCFGDYGYFSPTWNHMNNYYAPQFAQQPDIWKKGQITFEVCGVIAEWESKGFDIQQIMAKALEWHGSTINAKSSLISPVSWMAPILEALKKLGYRFVLRELRHSANINAGEKMMVQMVWENIGVAPPYHDYRLALEFSPAGGGVSWQHEFDNVDMKQWLPGTHVVAESISVPAGISAGPHVVKVGILDPQSGKPVVALAIAGKDANGWYPLSLVSVAMRTRPHKPIGALDFCARSDPLGRTAIIGFGLAGPAQVAISVYAATGKKIRSFANRPLPAGNHEILWNVQNDRGEAIGNGLYLVKAVVDREVRVHNLVFIRE